jgi:hypothetical protein
MTASFLNGVGMSFVAPDPLRCGEAYHVPASTCQSVEAYQRRRLSDDYVYPFVDGMVLKVRDSRQSLCSSNPAPLPERPERAARRPGRPSSSRTAVDVSKGRE